MKYFILFVLFFSTSISFLAQSLNINKNKSGEIFINIPKAENSNFVLEERSTVNGIGWIPYFNHPLPFDEKKWQIPNSASNSSYFKLRLGGEKVNRGKIISAKRLQTWSPFIINLFLVLEDIDVRVKNQVEAWKIIYETVDPWGLKIIASGSVFIPKVSNDVNIPIEDTVISSVLDESIVDVIFSGFTSDSTPESVTISKLEYIP